MLLVLTRRYETIFMPMGTLADGDCRYGPGVLKATAVSARAGPALPGVPYVGNAQSSEQAEDSGLSSAIVRFRSVRFGTGRILR